MKLRKKQQNNAQIVQLFDGFAESLPAKPHLAQKAADKAMSSARPKNKRFGWVFALATCCVVILIAVCVFPNLNIGAPQNPAPGDLEPSGPAQDNPAPGNPAPSVQVFDSEDVGHRIILASARAEKLLPISVLKEQPQFKVTYERYYAYYFNNSGELAYIQAILGVETEYGIVEISLIADNQNYVEQSRLEVYNYNILNSNQQVVLTNSAADKGEYVTRAYFNANNFNFYIYARSNYQNSANAEEIVKIFSQKWDKTAN